MTQVPTQFKGGQKSQVRKKMGGHQWTQSKDRRCGVKGKQGHGCTSEGIFLGRTVEKASLRSVYRKHFLPQTVSHGGSAVG